MKSILGMTAFSVVLMGVGVASVQASDASTGLDQGSQLLLAEGGSERLMRQQQRMQMLAGQRSAVDEGERFVQMIEDNPTAAGPSTIEHEQEQRSKAASKSPLYMERGLNGSPH
jgi:hypothetical protein